MQQSSPIVFGGAIDFKEILVSKEPIVKFFFVESRKFHLLFGKNLGLVQTESLDQILDLINRLIQESLLLKFSLLYHLHQLSFGFAYFSCWNHCNRTCWSGVYFACRYMFSESVKSCCVKFQVFLLLHNHLGPFFLNWEWNKARKRAPKV